jgi:REP element-mobilizing transposase RayT
MAGTYTQLNFHVVFSTKRREPLIKPRLRQDLYPYIGGTLRSQKCIPLEIGGMPDHIHLVIRLRPDKSMSELVRLIKANSSKWVDERPDRVGRFAWQAGYAAFSVSLSQLTGVREYVKTQESHHRKKTFQEEFTDFLNRHEIAFDERYVWD